MNIKRRLAAVEQARAPKPIRCTVYPLAALTAPQGGPQGPIMVVPDPVPLDEWEQQAQAHHREAGITA